MVIVRNALAGLGFLAIAAAAVVGLNAYGGSSFGDDNPPRLIVNVRGLDLTTAAGMDELNDRIEMAVRRVCGHETSAWNAEKCRRDAWAGVRPQIERTIERRRYSRREGAPALVDVIEDVAHQPLRARRPIRQALVRAFDTGITANWYSWSAKGLVFAGEPYLEQGLTCRRLTVTRKANGQQELLTEGPVCRSPYGVLEAPLS